jgi:hypothetical protein
MTNAATTRKLIQTALSDGFVSTPGGFRQRSKVHLVRPGESVIKRAGASFVMNLSNGCLTGSSEGGVAARNPADQSGGSVIWASWQNATGTAISSFATNWIVPAPPTAPASQLVYIFNGLQNAVGSEILQPVLQWGSSGRVAAPSGASRAGTSTRRGTRIARLRHR